MAGLLGRIDEHLQQLYGKPTFHLGLGLLGRRDQDFGRALGGAFNDYANWQVQNQQMQTRQQQNELAKAEALRQQQAMAAKQQAAMQQAAALQKAGFDPNLPSNVLGQQAQLKYAPPSAPSTFAEQMAFMQTPKGQEALKAYYEMKNAGTGTNVKITNEMPSLHKGVERDAQSAVLSAQAALDEAGVAADFLQLAPELANPFARAMTTAGSLISGLGEFTGSSAIKQAGEMVRPDAVYTESGEKVTPRTIRSQMLTLKTAAREIMAPDKGPLTRQEQNDYKEAVGLLDSADAQEQLDGVNQLQTVMTRRVKRLERTLRVSGAAVPGEQAPTEEDLKYTAQKHGISVQEVKRRLGIR